MKLKDLLKEEEGLSSGEKFGLKEVGEEIVKTHKKLNDLLLKYMTGLKKYHSNHRRKNPELAKKLEIFYKHLKGSYYYTTKQAAGKYLHKFQQTVRDLTEGKLKEEILKGSVVSGGSEAAIDVMRAMTSGNSSRVGNLSNMSNWIGQYKDGVEFGLKKKMKVGGKVVSIVQIKVTGKDKFTIAYLDWDDGKRPLLTRKIIKNVSGKSLPRLLKKDVKVG